MTIEFVNDEVLVSAPCFYTGSDKDLMYHAGTCSIALVTLEKSTKDGKWEQVGEEELLDFISNVREGKMKISGSLSDGEITIGTKDIVTSDGSEFKNQASFTVDDADSIKSEMDGVRSSNGYVKATKKVILRIASTGGNAFGDASAAEIYKNKDGQFDDLYQDTMYVLAIEFTN